jgi:hypothetical protein
MLRLHRIVPVAVAVTTLVAGSACASTGYYGQPSVRTYDDRGYRVGYDEGRSRGENDARHGRDYNYERQKEFRSGDAGYRGYGSRDAYRHDFRQGFIRGYDDGYRRYARVYRDDRIYRDQDSGYGNGRRYGYASPAGQNGFRDGYEQGRDDARDRDRYDPVRASRYRSGDHDYDRRYGSRDDYKRDYRAAFQQGYDQGYREVRGR